MISTSALADTNIDYMVKRKILDKYQNANLKKTSISFYHVWGEKNHKPKNGIFPNVDPRFLMTVSKKIPSKSVKSISLFIKSKLTNNAKFIVKHELGEFYGQFPKYNYTILRAIPIYFETCTKNTIYAIFETSEVLLWDSVEVHVPGCIENG